MKALQTTTREGSRQFIMYSTHYSLGQLYSRQNWVAILCLQRQCMGARLGCKTITRTVAFLSGIPGVIARVTKELINGSGLDRKPIGGLKARVNCNLGNGV